MALGRQREVGEFKFAALGIRADHVSLLRLQERQSLRTRPVRIDAHGGGESCLRLDASGLRKTTVLTTGVYHSKTRRRSSRLGIVFGRSKCTRRVRTENDVNEQFETRVSIINHAQFVIPNRMASFCNCCV